MNPKDAPIESFKNRKNLNGSCGCFACMTVFDVNEIKEWTDEDQTAICPKCNKDSVISEIDNLKEIHEHWFCQSSQDHSELTSQERLQQRKK